MLHAFEMLGLKCFEGEVCIGSTTQSVGRFLMNDLEWDSVQGSVKGMCEGLVYMEMQNGMFGVWWVY